MSSGLDMKVSRNRIQMRTRDWDEFARTSPSEDFEAMETFLQQRLPVRLFNDAGECDRSLDRSSEFADFIAKARKARGEKKED